MESTNQPTPSRRLLINVLTFVWLFSTWIAFDALTTLYHAHLPVRHLLISALEFAVVFTLLFIFVDWFREWRKR
jgi:hypothetical protein